jgi:hypothetical protein
MAQSFQQSTPVGSHPRAKSGSPLREKLRQRSFLGDHAVPFQRPSVPLARSDRGKPTGIHVIPIPRGSRLDLGSFSGCGERH